MTRKQAAQELAKTLNLTAEETAALVAKADDTDLGWKGADEYNAIATEKAKIEADYARAKNSDEWLQRNGAAVQAMQARMVKYQERFGEIDDAGNGAGAGVGAGDGAGAGMTKDAIAKLVQEGVNAQLQALTPVWGKTVTGTNKVVERHIRAGRKTEIDWKAIEEKTQANGGNIEAAYDEWDAPERTKAQTEATEAEIKRRVAEAVAAARSSENFPAGADGGVGGGAFNRGLLRSSLDDKQTYNRSAVLETARSGKYEKVQ